MQYHSHPSCHYHYSCSSSPSFSPCQLTPLFSYCQPLQSSNSANSRCPSTTVHHHYHYLSPSPSSSRCCFTTSSCKTNYNPSKSNHSFNCKPTATLIPSSGSSTTGSISTRTSKASSSNTMISANSAQKDPGNHSNDPRHRHFPPNKHQWKQYKLLTHAIQELIQSERDYVDELYIMVEICLAALHQQKWVSAKHVAVMSRNLSDIFAFHQRLVTSFRVPIIMQDHPHSDPSGAMTTTSIESKCRIIARAFLDHQSDFKALYIEYCEGHSKAWNICTEYRSKSEWPDFMIKCQGLIQAYQEGKSSAAHASSSASPPPPTPGKRIRFEDFLIKPIQRICRYQLLLKEIIRHANQYASISHPTSTSITTPKTKRHSHQQLLTQAFDCMYTIATEIDQQNEAQESQERTHRFLERLDSDWRLAKNHVAQLGCLVISGALDIRYQNGGGGDISPSFNDQHELSPSFPSPPPSPSPSSKSRYLGCFVFSSYVIIVQVKKQTLYEAKHWFPLHVVDLIDPDSDNSDFVLQIQQHIFICAASCAKEKKTWVDKIRSAKTSLLLSQQWVDHSGLVSSLSNQPSTNRLRQPSPPLLRSSTTFFDMADQYQYHPHRSPFTEPSTHLPSSSSSPSLPTVIHQLPLSVEVPCKKKKNRSLSTHITSTRYQSGSQPSSPTFRPSSSNLISTELPPPTRRHSSLDLFSMATQNLNRVSLHFKTQHRNALREAVDQRIRDVCTRDYLSSRARYLALDRKSSGASAMGGTNIVSSTTSSTSSSSLVLSPSPPLTVGAVPTTTSTAFSSSSISSVSSSIPSPSYYYGNHPSRTPSPAFLHPLASPPLSFNLQAPTSTPLLTSVAGPTLTKDKTPMDKKNTQSVDKGKSRKIIELTSSSGKATMVINSTPTLPPPPPKKRRGPHLIKSLWHHLIRSLQKTKKKKKPKGKEEVASTQSRPPPPSFLRPMIIQEEDEDRPEPQRKENNPLTTSPSVIMYSDFQLYRRSLNLE